MTLRLGVGLPQVFGSGPVNAAEIIEVAKLSEQMGFDSVWTQEDVLGPSGTLDPLATLAYVASQTERVDLGVAVLLAPVMDPVQLAKTTTTLDQLSGGRLVVGIGLGSNADEYVAHGLSSRGRAQRFEYIIDALTALWSGGTAKLPGSPFDLSKAQISPPPRQLPCPRLWFGGHADAALSRAVRWGNGFIGGGAMPAPEFRGAVRRLRALLGDRSQFSVAKRVYLACTNHHSNARQRLLHWLTTYYGSADLAERVAVVGDVNHIVDSLAELVCAGAEELVLNFVFEEEMAVEAAAHEIVPALRLAVEGHREGLV